MNRTLTAAIALTHVIPSVARDLGGCAAEQASVPPVPQVPRYARNDSA